MDYNQIRAFIFDVDGVLTDGSLLCLASGEQVRAFNIKDGFAIRLAIKKGYPLAIISGREEAGVHQRLRSLDVTYIYLGIDNKEKVFDDFLTAQNLRPSQIAFMGDDVPDLTVLRRVGLAACPADAAADVRAVCHYISALPGGKGAARDLIELILKAQQNW